MLVAYIKEDFGWVRGRVVQVVEEERVTVKLLDYQILDVVTNINTLRIHPEDLKQIPSPALVMKLAIAPAEDIDPLSSLNNTTQNIQFYILTVFFNANKLIKSSQCQC